MPIFKILIIEDNFELLEQMIDSIQRSIATYRREDITFEILSAVSLPETMELLKTDGDIQAVILSWEFQEEKQKQGVDGEEHNSRVIKEIKEIRIEIPIYVISDDSKGIQVIEDSERVESFFYRSDLISDPDFIMGYILNDFDDRIQTPFWTAYKKYVNSSNDSWHTPGHSSGSSFRNSSYINDFYHFYGRNVFAGDLSISVDSLGSLSDSSNYIKKAQEAAAYTFEVKKTFFVTNGSSTSNKIILQSLLKPGDRAIIDRNCHKSIHYGMIQAAAYPIYLESAFEPSYGIFAPPTLENIRRAIEENPDAKLIVLTGCSYEGILMDLSQVVKMAHAAGIKVFIDEAWFAYSLFHPRFRHYSAINCGADYVTHSAHKVMSAFSQASYIHINDLDFDENFFREVYNIYTSTSPKYQIISSLDVCHKQLEMEGFKILNNLLSWVEELKNSVSKLKSIRIVDESDFARLFSHFKQDNIGVDPLKVLIDFSNLEVSMEDILRFLQDEIGLEVEKSTHSTVLVLLTIGCTRSKVIRLFNALKKLDDGAGHFKRSKAKRAFAESLPSIDLKMLPRDAFFCQRESIPYEMSVGRVSSGLVTPYPPGIPLIVPGQKIEQQHVDFISKCRTSSIGIVVQGVFDGEIYVVPVEE